MGKISFLSCVFLLFFSSAADTSENELLKPVNKEKSARLIEYNSGYIEKELFFSKRHRIVVADVKLLLKGEDIIVTPFENELPILIKHERTTEDDGSIGSFGYFKFNHAIVDTSESEEIRWPAIITLLPWDVDDAGNAVESSKNGFKHARLWTFDENDNPVIDSSVAGRKGVIGPPPSTPGDIANHKLLKRMKARSFSSVSATFYSNSGQKFILRQLSFTPKYSVIYEDDAEKRSFVRTDYRPDGDYNRTDSQKQLLREYRSLAESLPKYSNKKIKGDI